MANRYATAARKARDLTNKQLGTEIASLGPMNRDRLNDLLPKKRDKETFLELMKIVESEREHDEKIAALSGNIQKLAGVTVKVLGFFL